MLVSVETFVDNFNLYFKTTFQNRTGELIIGVFDLVDDFLDLSVE